MDAGRELDALVAEKVFGFWKEGGTWFGPHPRTPGAKAYASVAVPGRLWGPSYGSDALPKFSTDIAAAWTVVEKMHGDPEFDAGLDNSYIFADHAAEAARLICLAALAAVGHSTSPSAGT